MVTVKKNPDENNTVHRYRANSNKSFNKSCCRQWQDMWFKMPSGRNDEHNAMQTN